MKRKVGGALLVAVFILVPLASKFVFAVPGRDADIVFLASTEIHPSILASGNLVFRQEVQLTSEVTGKVTEVLVAEGDKVEKGQALLQLDPTTYRAEVAQQKASQRSAGIAIERAQLNETNQQLSLDRSRKLVQAKFIDASKFDDASHQMDLVKVELRASREAYQQASAQLTLATERLAKTEVHAPISGTVTAVQIKIGETAVASATSMAGSSLMTIANIDSMMAEVNVDESDIARISIGQQAHVYPSAFPTQPITGTVERVSMTPKTGGQGRSYIVRLRLSKPEIPLRTGMTCRVDIIVKAGGAKPTLPIAAILSEDASDSKESSKSSSYVFTLVNGHAKKTPVQLGMADDINQEILKGIPAGQAVILGPARTLRELRDGDAITARKLALAATSNKSGEK